MLAELDRLHREHRFALLVISHGLDPVAGLADRLVVLNGGVAATFTTVHQPPDAHGSAQRSQLPMTVWSRG